MDINGAPDDPIVMANLRECQAAIIRRAVSHWTGDLYDSVWLSARHYGYWPGDIRIFKVIANHVGGSMTDWLATGPDIQAALMELANRLEPRGILNLG